MKEPQEKPTVFDPKAVAPVFNPKADRLKQDREQAQAQAVREGEVLGNALIAQTGIACMKFWMAQAKFTDKDKCETVSDLMDVALGSLIPLDQFPEGYPIEALSECREDLENNLRGWLLESFMGEKEND